MDGEYFESQTVRSQLIYNIVIMMEEDSKQKQIVAIVVVLIVIILVFGGLALTSKDKNTSNSTETVPAVTTSQPEDNTSPTSATGYKDGNYTATGSYTSPGGREKITITITLKDGKVSGTSATQGATDDEAEEYQAKFISGYKSQVVGKDIDSLSLTRVSGSSLTPQGFNNAIEQIKNQAKA